MFPARIELATFRVLGGRDNHYTTETATKDMWNVRDVLPWGTKFLLVLNFAVFPAIRKNKFPQIRITADIFSAKIYSRVNILWLKFSTQ